MLRSGKEVDELQQDGSDDKTTTSDSECDENEGILAYFVRLFHNVTRGIGSLASSKWPAISAEHQVEGGKTWKRASRARFDFWLCLLALV